MGSRGGLVGRGALIVLEGGDRVGKSTQARMLSKADALAGRCQLISFPDRTTPSGKLIDEYLRCKSELDDRSIHLLFTANRWELRSKVIQQLCAGTTLIVDRYSYSGVAFSSAKEGMNMKWCCQPEIGLPKPDAVFYLQLSQQAAALRGQYGMERYEKRDFQERVQQNYMKLVDDTWKVLNADKTADALHAELLAATLEVVNQVKDRTLGKLWSDGLPAGVEDA